MRYAAVAVGLLPVLFVVLAMWFARRRYIQAAFILWGGALAIYAMLALKIAFAGRW